MFRPDITLKIQELDIQEEPTSVPVALGDFGITLPDEMGEDEIRIIEVEFPLTLKGNLYLPIKDSEIIREIEVNMSVIEAKRNDQAIKFELDYPEEAEAIASTIGAKSEANPDIRNLEEVEQEREIAVTTIKNYKNTKPTIIE